MIQLRRELLSIKEEISNKNSELETRKKYLKMLKIQDLEVTSLAFSLGK